MKRTILFTCALLISGVLFAKPDTTKTAMREGIQKKYGKMWYIKFLPDSMPLENGMMVYATGILKEPGGKAYTFSEGERSDFLGAIAGMDQKIDESNGMVVMNHHYMWLWTELDKPTRLKNGEYAMPDGTLKLRSGKYIPIKDETFIDFDGHITEPVKKEVVSEALK